MLPGAVRWHGGRVEEQHAVASGGARAARGRRWLVPAPGEPLLQSALRRGSPVALAGGSLSGGSHGRRPTARPGAAAPARSRWGHDPPARRPPARAPPARAAVPDPGRHALCRSGARPDRPRLHAARRRRDLPRGARRQHVLPLQPLRSGARSARSRPAAAAQHGPLDGDRALGGARAGHGRLARDGGADGLELRRLRALVPQAPGRRSAGALRARPALDLPVPARGRGRAT